jgi:hypothetical protein
LSVGSGETGLDEVLELFDRTAKRIEKAVEETKEASVRQSIAYEQILKMPEATQEQRLKAFIAKTLELDRLERLSSQLSLVYSLQIFAFKVKVLEVSVGNINEQLVKSGVLQKSGELEDIKTNIDALKILIEAHYESMKEISENQNRNLGYIH